MWKLFSQNENDPAVYLKVETFEDVIETPEDRLRYKITVTNYIKMWCVVYNNESMIQMMLNSNKGTETEDKQAFMDIGLQMLHDPKMLDEKVFTETQSGNLSVRLLCKTPIVLRMNFTLSLCSSEQFYQFITRPLLEVINDLQNSEKKLRHHLIKKDGEIRGFMDMVPEGSPLMRCLRTEPYNDLKHMKTHSAVDKLFGTNPVEVSPGHIIRNGRPLPIEAESNSLKTLPSMKPSGETKHSLLSTAVKIEPTESSQLTLQLQIPAVKSEPLNNVNSEPNNLNHEEVKQELDTNDLNHNSTGGMLESNVSKDETNKSAGKDNSREKESFDNKLNGQDNTWDLNSARENTDITALNDHSLQIDTYYLHTQSEKEDLKVSNTEGTVDTKSEIINKRSPETNSEQKPITPKKKRKKLNY